MRKVREKQYPNHVIVLGLAGKITIGGGDSHLRDIFMDAVHHGNTKVVLDMAGITDVDPSGIGELVGCYTTIKDRGGELRLLHVPTKLDERFHVTQLVTVFEIHQTEAEAVASFDE